MKFRPYSTADKIACLAIFDSNTPPYFAEHERPDFSAFLDAPEGRYFVVEESNGAIIACGGYWPFPERRMAILTWGMVARAHHKQGFGRWLLFYRLDQLCATDSVAVVKLATSQYTAGFFERSGFRTDEIVENGYAPGLHKYTMSLTCDADLCEAIARQLQET